MSFWKKIARPFSGGPAVKALPYATEGRESGILAGILSTSKAAPTRGTKELLAAYSELPWLRAVVDRISVSVASTQWMVYRKATPSEKMHSPAIRKDHDRVIVYDSPFNELFDNPNPCMTGRTLRQAAQIYLELAGESFIIIERNDQGQPVELWPIPPTWVKEVPTNDVSTFSVSYNSLQMDVEEKDMLWLKYPNPSNPYDRGSGIGQTLGDELDTDEYTAKHVKSWFYNRATPELLIGVKGASESQLRGAKQAWEDAHRGSFRAFNSHWHSGELDVEQLSQTFADQQLIELRRYERDIIIHTFGIPAELLGITENSNRATIESADYLYSRWTVVPRLEFWRTELQEKILSSFGDNLYLEYKNPVPEDKEFQKEMIKTAPYAFSVNEIREVAGFGPVSDGDKFPVDPSMSFSYGPTTAEDDAEVVDIDQEKKIKSVTKTVTPAMIDTIVDSVSPVVLNEYTDKEMYEVVDEMGNATMVAAGLESSFNMLSPQVVEFLQGYSSDRIVGINNTTRNEIKDELTQGVLLGEDIDDLSKRIKGKYKEFYKNRSKTIARTEVLRSSNFARFQGLSQPGVFEGKRWLTARDGRVRFVGTLSGHRALHGKEVMMNEPFRLGDSSAMYPGDFGVANLDINCRCTIVPVVEVRKSIKKETEEEQRTDQEFIEEAESVPFTEQQISFASEFDDFVEAKIPGIEKSFINAFEEQERQLIETMRRIAL